MSYTVLTTPRAPLKIGGLPAGSNARQAKFDSREATMWAAPTDLPREGESRSTLRGRDNPLVELKQPASHRLGLVPDLLPAGRFHAWLADLERKAAA